MLKQLPMTARLKNAGSVIRNLQRPEKKPKSTKTPTAEPESQAFVLRTSTTACFCSALKELIFNSLKLLRDDHVLMIGMIPAIAW